MADSDATGWLERAGDIQGRPPGERGPSGWIRTLGTACRAGHDLFDTVVARTQDVAPSPCRNSGDGLEGVGHSPQGAGHRVAHSGAGGFGPTINVWLRGTLSTRLLPPITLPFLDDLVRNDRNHRQPLLSGPGRLMFSSRSTAVECAVRKLSNHSTDVNSGGPTASAITFSGGPTPVDNNRTSVL